MLNFITPITESYSFDNFSMKEKTPIAKINLRGNLNNIEFVTNAEKILEMPLPKRAGDTSAKEKITLLWLGPNEWILVSNFEIAKETNIYELEQVLFDGISKPNLGAVTNVTDHFTIFSLSGTNIFKILCKGCPYDFESKNFSDNKAVRTIINHIDVTIHRKNKNNIDLYVRRSFANYLWNWLKDSADLN
jgi:sarcosine oxidase subunit gamma|tara:strand:- start:94 stop:663 length:570 start_codon:yes stop_codon:yes gene_type:complete